MHVTRMGALFALCLLLSCSPAREETKTTTPTAEQPQESAAGDEEVYTIADEVASPVDGMDAFQQKIMGAIVYPKEAREKNVSGTVYVEFVVRKDGSMTDVRVVRGIGSGCDEAALMAVRGAAKWNPARIKGEAVNQRMVLPVNFKLP